MGYSAKLNECIVFRGWGQRWFGVFWGVRKGGISQVKGLEGAFVARMRRPGVAAPFFTGLFRRAKGPTINPKGKSKGVRQRAKDKGKNKARKAKILRWQRVCFPTHLDETAMNGAPGTLRRSYFPTHRNVRDGWGTREVVLGEGKQEELVK